MCFNEESFPQRSDSFIYTKKGKKNQQFLHYHELHEERSHKKTDKEQNISLKLHCRQWAITDNAF